MEYQTPDGELREFGELAREKVGFAMILALVITLIAMIWTLAQPVTLATPLMLAVEIPTLIIESVIFMMAWDGPPKN